MPPSTLMNSTLQGVTALLVDDEAYFRRFVGQVLHSHGVGRLVEACNGSEAVEIGRATRPDIAIMDINMPEVDGLTALIALRQIMPDLPVVMLTSIADEMVVEKCVEEGAAFFIRKDVPADELVQELNRVVDEFLGQRGLPA